MRILSWLAGIVVVLALSVSANSVVRAHSNTTHALVAGKPAAAAAPYNVVEADDPPRAARRPVPEPTPTPEPPAPAPAPPAAPAPAPPPPPRPAPPAVVVGSTQQALINQDRAANGLGPLTWSSCLYNVAVSNANRMASTMGSSTRCSWTAPVTAPTSSVHTTTWARRGWWPPTATRISPSSSVRSSAPAE